MLPITVDTGIGTVDLHIQQAHSFFGCSVSSKKTHHKSCLVKLWTYSYAFIYLRFGVKNDNNKWTKEWKKHENQTTSVSTIL